jgi:hypothetical protein
VEIENSAGSLGKLDQNYSKALRAITKPIVIVAKGTPRHGNGHLQADAVTYAQLSVNEKLTAR